MSIFRPSITLFCCFGLLGCQTDIETKPVSEESVQQNLQLTLDLSVDQEQGLAGELFGYSANVTDQFGNNLNDEIEWQITSDVELDLYWTESHMMPIVSGSHTVHVQATYFPKEEDLVEDSELDGIVLQQSILLEITPLGVDVIDLQLDQGVATAGENVPYRAVLMDRFGNEIQDEEFNSNIEIYPDGLDLMITDSQIYSSVADIYGITAQYGDLGDTEFLEVVPDIADSITLVVPNENIEKYDSIQCEILIEDRFGNLLDTDWTLWTEGTGSTDTAYNIITFLEEGSYMVYANTFSEDGTELMDQFGPVLVDSSGPTLIVNTPNRGDWTESINTTVSGTVVEEFSVLLDLTVDGVSLQPDSVGAFSGEMNLNEGITVIETEAIDTDGNLSNDVRSVLSGTFEPKDEPIDDVFQVYLGSSGIDSLEANVETIVGDIDIASLLPSNPVSSQGVAWCTAYINVYNVNYGSATLDIDPQSNGYINVTMTVPNISMDLDVPLNGGSWWQPCPDFSGDVSASSLVANITLNPYVSNNEIYLSIVASDASLNGLNVSLNGWGSVLNFIVNFFEGDIADALEDEIQNQLSTQVPPLLEDTLQSIELSTSFDLMGSTFTMDALPSSIFADDNGVGFGMQANVTADNWAMNHNGLGSFVQGFSPPSFPSNSGYNLALSTDFINQLMYQIWGTGIIAQELSLSELGIDSEDIEVIFPNSSDLRITIEPILPPVVVAENNVVELQMGELYLAVHNGDYTNGDIRLEVYTHIFAPLTLGLSSTLLTANVGTPETFFDVVYPMEGASGTETLLDALIPIILPTFTDAISEIPLPTFAGVTLSGLTSSVDGGHLTVTGNVSF